MPEAAGVTDRLATPRTTLYNRSGASERCDPPTWQRGRWWRRCCCQPLRPQQRRPRVGLRRGCGHATCAAGSRRRWTRRSCLRAACRRRTLTACRRWLREESAVQRRGHPQRGRREPAGTPQRRASCRSRCRNRARRSCCGGRRKPCRWRGAGSRGSCVRQSPCGTTGGRASRGSPACHIAAEATGHGGGAVPRHHSAKRPTCTRAAMETFVSGTRSRLTSCSLTLPRTRTSMPLRSKSMKGSPRR